MKLKATAYAVLLFILIAEACLPLSFTSAQTFAFGNSQVGKQSDSTFGGMYVSNFTSPGNVGNITKIEVYMATGGTVAQAVVYLDNNGKPDALVAASNLVTIEGTGGRWVTFELSLEAIPVFNYWIGVLFQGAATYYYTPNSSETAITYVEAGEPSNFFPSGTQTEDSALSVQAIFEPVPLQDQVDWIQIALLVVVVVGVVFAVVAVVLVLIRERKNSSF